MKDEKKRGKPADRYTSHVIFLMQFAHLITCISHCMAQDEPPNVSVLRVFVPSSCHPWCVLERSLVVPCLSLLVLSFSCFSPSFTSSLPHSTCTLPGTPSSMSTPPRVRTHASWGVLLYGDVPPSHKTRREKHSVYTLIFFWKMHDGKWKVFFETMECRNLFCFWKIKENENPKKRFEQQTLFGVYAHVEVHTTHFLLHMQSGSSHTELSEGLRLFFACFEWWAKANASRQEHRPPYRLTAFRRTSTVSGHSKLADFCCCITHGNVPNLWHHDSFLHIFLSRTICKKTPFLHPCSSITPTLHHFVVTTPSFDFKRLFESELCGSRRKRPLQVPVRLTNGWKARTNTTCTHRKSGKPSFRLSPQSFRKVVRPPFNILNYTQKQGGSQTNRGNTE